MEKHIEGKDYRLLIAGGNGSGCGTQGTCVTGNGIHTIRELVEIENKTPLRGDGHEKPLTAISLDDISRQVLAKNGYSEDSIPGKGEKVLLRYNGNLSTGGTARDCTDEVHPHNAALAEKAAELMELDIAGIDITCPDISKPLDMDNGAVIEVNAAPGLRMHIYPAEGKPRNVAGAILDHLFPAGRPNSIPIVSVTGTNGKTTVTRMIAHTLRCGGINTGMATTGGIYIGDECIQKGDNTGALSAARVLSDTRVEAAVLETARGGIIKRGLGYDLADVGVIVNISDDHLGLDGIDTIEEMAMVKSLVAEAVRPEGTAVLNADDEMTTPFILKRVKCTPLLFSSGIDNLLIQKWLKEGRCGICQGRRHIRLFIRQGEAYRADQGHPDNIRGQSRVQHREFSCCRVSAPCIGYAGRKIRKGVMSFTPDRLQTRAGSTFSTWADSP